MKAQKKNGHGLYQQKQGSTSNGVLARADAFRYDGSGTLQLGSHFKSFSVPASYHVWHSGSLTGSIPVFFKDLHINGGAPTSGSLEVTVFGKVVPGEPGDNYSVANIQLDSLTYNSSRPGFEPCPSGDWEPAAFLRCVAGEQRKKPRKSSSPSS